MFPFDEYTGINDGTLLMAISRRNKKWLLYAIDRAKLDFPKFCRENAASFSVSDLAFLMDVFKVPLAVFGKRYDALDLTGQELCLKRGHRPTTKQIELASSSVEARDLDLMLRYGVKIPPMLLFHWATVNCAKAIELYLAYGGEPNVRKYPLIRKLEKTGKPVSFKLSSLRSSMIGEIYYHQGDCPLVRLIQAKGGLLPPLARTREEEQEEEERINKAKEGRLHAGYKVALERLEAMRALREAEAAKGMDEGRREEFDYEIEDLAKRVNFLRSLI